MTDIELPFPIDDINESPVSTTDEEELPFPNGHWDILPDPIKQVLDVQDDPEPELTDEQKELLRKKEKAQRCKVIALSKMNLDPINTNVSCLCYNTKIKILESVRELFECDNDDIIKQFNAIIVNDVLKVEKDYTQYPIYKTSI
jgi:hypothetical protein